MESSEKNSMVSAIIEALIYLRFYTRSTVTDIYISRGCTYVCLGKMVAIPHRRGDVGATTVVSIDEIILHLPYNETSN